MVEQVLLHEVAVALIVLGRKAAVLVQVERRDLSEAELARLEVSHEVGVQADGRRARGQAQHARRVGLHERGDAIGGAAAHVLRALGDDEFHAHPFVPSHRAHKAPSTTQPVRSRTAQSPRYPGTPTNRCRSTSPSPARSTEARCTAPTVPQARAAPSSATSASLNRGEDSRSR